MPIETFNISFESTQNKQQYGIKITCTEVSFFCVFFCNDLKFDFKIGFLVCHVYIVHPLLGQKLENKFVWNSRKLKKGTV